MRPSPDRFELRCECQRRVSARRARQSKSEDGSLHNVASGVADLVEGLEDCALGVAGNLNEREKVVSQLHGKGSGRHAETDH